MKRFVVLSLFAALALSLFTTDADAARVRRGRRVIRRGPAAVVVAPAAVVVQPVVRVRVR